MNESPLNLNQIKLIDQINLPTIEKHHLRVLAHCLETFKVMPQKESTKDLPSKQEQLDWCASNPKIFKDRQFILVLLNQFTSAAFVLQEIANNLKISPLDLTLDDLISDALRRSSKELG